MTPRAAQFALFTFTFLEGNPGRVCSGKANFRSWQSGLTKIGKAKKSCHTPGGSRSWQAIGSEIQKDKKMKFRSIVTLYGRAVAGVDYQNNIANDQSKGSGHLWRHAGNPSRKRNLGR